VQTPKHAGSAEAKGSYLFEDVADSVVQPDDPAGEQRWPLPEEEVRRKHADEREVLLAAEAHDGQGGFHASGQVLVLYTLHPGNLLCVLQQVVFQLLLICTASPGDVHFHGAG